MLRSMKKLRRLADSEKKRFFALAHRLTMSLDPSEKQRIKNELARMTFGEQLSRG